MRDEAVSVAHAGIPAFYCTDETGPVITVRTERVRHVCHRRTSHPARAVVPPPRLRAKWVVFSAHLRTTLDGVGWALAWRFRGGRNLRNPAKVDVFGDAYKHAHTGEFSRGRGKKVSFFLRGGV